MRLRLTLPKCLQRIFLRRLKSEIEDAGALNVIKHEKSGDIILLEMNRFCGMKIISGFSKTCKWKVIAFVESHNHGLTPLRFVRLILAYHGMSYADKAQVNSLLSVGVRTCRIMGYIVAYKGGYAKVGFTKKDLYKPH